MLILDTNVLAELMRSEPNDRVLNWLEKQPSDTLFSTVINEAETLYGISLLPSGLRREKLQAQASKLFRDILRGRLVPLESSGAVMYGQIASRRRLLGRPISQMDALIAAITACCSATLVTRNVLDFQDCGLTLINPWDPNLCQTLD
jgi:toxin FitB